MSEEIKSAEVKKVSIDYSCECCGSSFKSGRTRSGEKLCEVCIGLRRALKSFVKRGLTEATVLKRAAKMLKA